MTANPVEQLDVSGPQRSQTLSVDEARRRCRRLARQHYENFSVLTRLVPKALREDFAVLYAFCRWADDLGDEIQSHERSLELLGWWRQELDLCFAGEPRHPVFVALAPTIEEHDLPQQPFNDLIRAFEQDQTVARYDTWDQLLEYCKLSANPVGRLVLMLLGEPRTERLFGPSDAICTALQLTNHWQDVRRDILDRDCIYIPRELITIDDFEQRLRQTAQQGFAGDHTFLGESRELIRACVERTWPLYETGDRLLGQLRGPSRSVVGLLASGGQHVLRLIELWNYETVLHRPKLNKAAKLGLIMTAWLKYRFQKQRGDDA